MVKSIGSHGVIQNRRKLCLEVIKNFKSCLVSPSRWGRIDEIDEIVTKFKDLDYFPDYTMVDYDEINTWENSIG